MRDCHTPCPPGVDMDVCHAGAVLDRHGQDGQRREDDHDVGTLISRPVGGVLSAVGLGHG